jgi:drug/metabolite transporter (DMT)-like permease
MGNGPETDMPQHTPSARLATSGGLLAILLWSTTIACSRSLTESLGPMSSASFVFLLGGSLGLSGLAVQGRLAWARIASAPRHLLVCGGLFVAYMACLYGALGLARDRSQVLEVGLLNYLWPMLTVLLSVFFLRLHVSLLLVPGTACALAGIVLTMAQEQGLSWSGLSRHVAATPTPYLLGLGAALTWALYSNLSRVWGSRADASGVFLFMIATGVILGSAALWTHESPRWTARGCAELGFLAVVSSLGYLLWDVAMRRGDMVLVATASYFTPFLSTLSSSLYLGVRAGPRLWLGCLLILGGAVLCKLAVHQAPAPVVGTAAPAD